MAPSVSNTAIKDNERDFKKPSVLIIDDENRVRQVCSQMLCQEGYAVSEAEHAEIGLQKIAQHHFDIILLDLLMPGMSGLEALVQIRARHPDTVVIVITGYATLDHAVEAMKNGAFDFISKPFSPQDLRLVVTKAIEQIHTLHDIANEKSRMRTMINHLAGGVMATDVRKQVALCNHAFLNLVGYHGTSPIGRSVEALIAEPKLLEMIDQALSMDADCFAELTAEVDIEARGHDQGRILGVRCVPFRDRLDRNLGTITVLHDITTLKKMEQMKSDFVSMVSHEIRGPLNSVIMQHKVILDELAGVVTQKQREILMRASEKIKALVTLSSELLDLAKMESGLIIMEKSTLDLSDLIEDQVAFHVPSAQSRGISLALTPLGALPKVLANRINMEEVLSNLIGNAIQYTPDSGCVTVSAQKEGNYVCIRIADSGFGIPPEDMDRIFTRFYRVKNDKTRYIVGTGLGLPIVKSIVDAHNGRITVESAVGKGSVFSVWIPIAIE